MSKPYLVGITGTIGAGKSLVGKLLSERGFMVVDTDQVVHELFASSENLQKAIEQRFGGTIIAPNGTINRGRLGEIVFNDEDARRDLEAIVHPAVVDACESIVDENNHEKVIFFLVPLLFEAHLDEHYNSIWTILTQERVLIERLKERTNLSEEELKKRIAAQMPQPEKAARSQATIDNSGTIAATEIQLEKLLNTLPLSRQN